MTEYDKIEDWILSVVGKRNENLSGFAPCPYAQRAMLKGDVLILLTSGEWSENMYDFNASLSTKRVILIADLDDRGYEELQLIQNKFCDKYPEYVMLIGHPKRPFYLNGVLTTYPNHPILYIQKSEDLREASNILLDAGYYNFWTKEQIDEVVNNKMRR